MADENIWTASGDGHFDQVKAFVAGGVSVNAQDENGYTPLAAAVSYGNVDIAKWLIENGANVNLRDADGDTPLMACEDAACADVLMAAGADLTATNNEGETALHIATADFREEMVAWLKQQYASRGLPLPDVPEPEEEGDEDLGGEDGEGEGDA